MSIERVRDAYAARAQEYVTAVGQIHHAEAEDREFVLSWAQRANGQILDVGCGPGQWTNYLAERDLEIEGIDPVPAFVECARTTYPASRYRVGRAENLGVPDGSLAGILAWFSLIHTNPREIDAALIEFVRALRPGGSVVIGYFEGEPGTAFDHAVTTAYYWSAAAFTERLELAGLTVESSGTRHEEGKRAQGAIVARNAGAPSGPDR